MSTHNQVCQPDLDPITRMPKLMVDPSYEVAPARLGRPNKPSARQVVSCACGDSYPADSYGAGFIVANGGVCENCNAAESNTQEHSKYHREIKPGVFVDVYDVLKAFDVRNGALQHLIKKALAPGQRGHKDLMADLDDIIASAKRAKELEQ